MENPNVALHMGSNINDNINTINSLSKFVISVLINLTLPNGEIGKNIMARILIATYAVSSSLT